MSQISQLTRTLLHLMWLVLVCSSLANAQNVETHLVTSTVNIVPNSISVADGLSQNSVTALEIDSFSRLWVGTQEGLNLLDMHGVNRIEELSHEFKLSGRVIYGLAQDKLGNMWVATNRGLDRVDIKSLSVQQVIHKPDSDAVMQLDCLSDGTLLYLSSGKLYLVDPISLHVTEVKSFKQPVVYFFAYQDTVLLRTQNQFVSFNPLTMMSEVYSLKKDRVGSVVSFTRSQSGHLWIVDNQNNLTQCNFDHCTSFTIKHNQEQLHSYRIQSVGDKLVVVTNLGILVSDNSFATSMLIQSNDSGLLDPTFLHRGGIIIRENGAIVIGNYSGLFEIPSNYQNISSYHIEQFLPGETIFSTARLMTERGERLVIAAKTAVYIVKVTASEFIIERNFPFSESTKGPHLISVGDRVFLSSHRFGLYEVKDTGLFAIAEDFKSEHYPRRLVIDIESIDENNQLLLTNTSVLKIAWSKQGNRIIWSTPLPATSTYRLLYHDDYLFIATFDGGVIYSKINDNLSSPPTKWQSLLGNDIALDIVKNDNRELIVSTVENGTMKLEKFNDGWRVANQSVDLSKPSMTTLCAVKSDDDYWLVTTNNGLLILDNMMKMKLHLTEHDGLGEEEYQQFGCGRVGEQLYAHGYNGLTIMPKQLAMLTKDVPKLSLIGAWNDDQVLTMTGQKLVALSPELLKLQFTAGPLPINGHAQIQHRFEREQEWQTVNSPTLLFSHLAEQKYQLSVRVANYDGSYSANKEFQLVILPPWWRSPTAYSIYVSLVLLLLWLGYKYNMDKQRKYANELELLVCERTMELELKQQEALLLHQEKAKFINEASHDLKNLCGLINLSVNNLGFTLDEEAQMNTQKAIQGAATQLSQLISNVVDISRLDAGMISPRIAPVNSMHLLNKIEQQFSLKCTERGITIINRSKTTFILQTDEHLLERLLFNLVNNAIENLNAGGIIECEVKENNQNLRLSVKDNGPGLPESVATRFQAALHSQSVRVTGSGLGLSIVLGISKVLSIKLMINSSEQGTEFTLVFTKKV
ncbi:ATP-binding protein [Pseudoalteromonas mariniglutinosa]|uniref:sensor histidine kinase n=1 Tax=Pseudoalteromonas mariniglutinosa TaxID=206042 RepID=UPI00384ABED8